MGLISGAYAHSAFYLGKTDIFEKRQNLKKKKAFQILKEGMAA